jgi:hypothetical protein
LALEENKKLPMLGGSTTIQIIKKRNFPFGKGFGS